MNFIISFFKSLFNIESKHIDLSNVLFFPNNYDKELYDYIRDNNSHSC